LYVQAVIPAVPSLDVTLGARYARVNNELSDGFTFDNETITDDVSVGTFGMAYQASNNWRLLVRIDQNFRFVKVDEYTNAQPFPAPPRTVILKTQEGLSLETGVEWVNGASSAKLVVYQLDMDNELAFDPVNYININLDETRRSGFTGSGRWQASQRLGVTASYTYTDAEVLNGAFSGKEIPFVAMHSGMISGDYQVSDKWQLYGEWLAVSDRVFSGDFNNVLSRLPGYGLVNIKAEYRIRDFTFSGRINNIFDKQYSDVGQLGTDPNTFAAREAYFPSPEINFLLTAAWGFI
jgi:iron complex outermembrane receptor protein